MQSKLWKVYIGYVKKGTKNNFASCSLLWIQLDNFC